VSSELQLIFAFMGGVVVTILIFIIALTTSRWAVSSMRKRVNNQVDKEIEKARQELRSAFGIKASSEDDIE
jgi:hypothetical protein